MKILIATGIYPPHAGGPSYYAESLKNEFEKLGHKVTVRTFSIERHLPTGIRHLVYFFKTFPAYLFTDWTLVLDTFSVGIPIGCMRKLFGGVAILRTGGDFLWEQFVERTGKKITFTDFYNHEGEFTTRDKVIKRLTQIFLQSLTHIVFSTEYQKNIWQKSYDFHTIPTSIIENQYDLSPQQSITQKETKEFITISRPMKLKNEELLQQAFKIAQKKVPTITLTVDHNIPRNEVMNRLRSAYAGVVVSLSEISPNFVIELLSMGKPAIVTKENGILNRIGSAVIAVDPLNVEEIANAIITIADDATYLQYQEKINQLSIRRPYSVLAKEFIVLASSFLQKH
ncbi:MAG: glycosyltransferase family 4 protein [Candidatus Campbellbacteria bacterium]|nr:glycosyltransferase family 4 protein [Candidatus Campbellbacteria bacterium]